MKGHFIIEWFHRSNCKETHYTGAMPIEGMTGIYVEDFDSIEEASRNPFEDEESAFEALGEFEVQENTFFKLISVSGSLERGPAMSRAAYEEANSRAAAEFEEALGPEGRRFLNECERLELKRGLRLKPTLN